MNRIDTRHYFCLFFIILLISCKASSGVGILSNFDKQIKGKVEKVKIPNDSILYPTMITCTDKNIALSDFFQPTLLSLFNYKDGTFVGHFLNKGLGKNEVNGMVALKSDHNDLFFYDTDKHILASVNAEYPNVIKNSVSTINIKEHLFKVYRINDNKSLASGAFANHPFAIIDNKTGSVENLFGVYPFKDTNELSDTQKGYACQGYSHYDPTNKRLAAATLSGEFIAFYDMDDLSNPRLIKTHGNVLPKFKKGKNGSVTFAHDNTYGFINVSGNKNYCVALYWGKTRDEYPHPNLFGGDTLLVYDWNGKPIKAIKLDDIYSTMTISQNSNTIFLVKKNIKNMKFAIDRINID